jgi:hypothetical protein
MRRLLVIGIVGLFAISCADAPAGGLDAAVGAGGVAMGDGCMAGQTRCVAGIEESCENNSFRSTGLPGMCLPDVCRDDDCEDRCTRAAADRAYIGCQYWPVDLDNAVEVSRRIPQNGVCDNPIEEYRENLEICVGPDFNAGLCDPGQSCPDGFQCLVAPACILNAQGSPFAVVVSNPSETQTATVTLSNAGGQEYQEEVPPGAVVKLYPNLVGLDPASIDHTSQTPSAYRLNSTEPIVAYQFNPLNNVGVFSNDGSLLIPRHAYDTIYYAMTMPTLGRRAGQVPVHDYHGYVSIVASEPGTTEIKFIAGADVRLGLGIPRLPAFMEHTFSLRQFDVLNLEAVSGEDLTGMRVESVDGETPFGVFVGHEAMVISDQGFNGLCCADHLEEQLFPASTWGSAYAIARTEPRNQVSRGGEAPDQLRILAQKRDTRVNFDPEPANHNCGVLPAGGFCDAFIDADTRVWSEQPLLVGHMLLSTGRAPLQQNDPGDPVVGDPALAFAVPFEQFRLDYTFLVPSEYEADYISVVSPQGGAVQLDGVEIGDQLTPFGGAFAGGRFPVEPGQHRLECRNGCGVLVYGYSQAVSYMFAGGLDLARITVP